MENALKMAIKCLELQEQGAEKMALEDAVHKLQTLRGSVFQRMMALVAPKEPLSVICHGDFWTNNMMFKYNDDKEPEEVMLLDLQVARYSSLVTDLLHFLYTSTEPHLTDLHYDRLLAVYHASLSSTLRRLSPTAPPVTLQDIIDEVEEYALYGLLISFLILPAVTAKDTIVNLDTIDKDSFMSEEFLEQSSNSINASCMSRIKELVLEFVDRGFI
jgi:thiamine kinase-like enzyme